MTNNLANDTSLTKDRARAELARRGIDWQTGKTMAESSSDTAASPQDYSHITKERALAELARRGLTPQGEKIEESTVEPEEVSFMDKVKHYGKETGRAAGRAARDVAIGAAETGDFLLTPVREGMNLGLKAFGSDKTINPMSHSIESGIDQVTDGSFAPKTDMERNVSAVTRGLASIPAGGAAGTLIKGAKFASPLLSGLAQKTGNFLAGANDVSTGAKAAHTIGTTGAVSYGIQDYLNNNQGDHLGALGKGLLYGVAGGKGINAAKNISQKGLMNTLSSEASDIGNSTGNAFGKMLKVSRDKVKQFQDSGVNPTLADVSDSKVLKMLQNKMEVLPGSSGVLGEAKNLQRKQVENIILPSEGYLSRNEAGELISKGAKNVRKAQQDKFSKLFNKLESDINELPDKNIGTENIEKFMSPLTSKIKNEYQEAKFLSSPLGKIYKGIHETAAKNEGKIDYHEMKDFLDEINDKITTHGQIGKVSQGKLKKLSESINKDIEADLGSKLKDLGQDSYDNWKKAKSAYKDYASNEIPALNEIFAKSKKDSAEVFTKLITEQKRGARTAKIALEGLPQEDRLSLVDAVNKQLGSTRTGEFSPVRWVSNIKSMSPEGKEVLFSPLSKTDKHKLNALVDTIDNIKGTLNEANSSKTDYYRSLGDAISGTGGATAALVTGSLTPAMYLAGMYMGMSGVAKYGVTNPKFINWMDRAMKAKSVDQFQKIIGNVPDFGSSKKAIIKTSEQFNRDIKKVKGEKES